jgi:glycosyltransferase involved in cell wall biosynthesis
MKCCFCGTVRNCAPYLEKNFQNIEILSELFEDYEIIIVYDKSDDNSLEILKKYQEKNNKLKLYVIPNFISPFRTHRLAHARNICFNYVQENNFPLFIMMDLDEVNAKEINPQILKKYLTGRNYNLWDSLSFNTSPNYYDIWALSIFPFCFSYIHFTNNSQHNYHTVQNYIEKLLKYKKTKNELLQCISAFNGFAIYKTLAFQNCKYNGKLNLNLLKIPPKYIINHKKASGGKFIINDYGNVNGKYEDCEHRLFHISAIKQNNAKIMISPDILYF